MHVRSENILILVGAIILDPGLKHRVYIWFNTYLFHKWQTNDKLFKSRLCLHFVLLFLTFFVFGLPDAKYGEKLVLFIEGVKNSISLSELKELELRTFEIPKEIHFLNTFIRTVTGKIQRKSTVNQFKESA